jgi:hypothetical protein
MRDQQEEKAERSRGGSGRLVAAGVLSACALGAGLGLWARPTDPHAAPSPVAPHLDPAQEPGLQIVVDDTPAPIGRPLEVLPSDGAAAGHETTPAVVAPAPAPVEPMAPRPSATGFVKVDAPAPVEPLVAPPIQAAVRPAPKAEPDRPKVDVAKAELLRAEAAKAEKAKADLLRAEAAKAEKARAEKARAARDAELARQRLAEAKAEKAAQLAEARAAAAEMAKAEKLAKAEKAKADKLRAEKAAKLARVEAKKPAAKPQAARREFAALVRVVKTAPAQLKTEAGRLARAKSPRQPVALAKAAPPTKPAKAKAVRTALVEKKAVPLARAAPPPRPAPAAKPALKGEASLRVARNTCAAADPGEAAVCADSRLSARDRQLQQAYRNAEAAGVPASTLRRQQARWQQARAAAAREAPWAVEDVYEARISELNEQIRDAREN